MHLFSASWHALPCHRVEGLGVSAALHIGAFALLAVLPPAAPVERPPDLVVTRVTAGAPASSPLDDGAQPSEGTSHAIEEAEADESFRGGPRLQLGGLAIDLEPILRQRAALFPFLTASLSFLDEVRQRFETEPGRLTNPFGRERASSPYPPLALSRREMQRTVDRAWSRRDRWESFSGIAALLQRHDPDDGDAAPLVRAHVDQNLLQPYFDGRTRDPRYWVTLGLTADHAPFLQFVEAYVRQYPSSRTTTELLFMLDEFAQASRDALLMLLSSDPWHALDDTRESDAGAFALAEWLYVHYGELARRQGLDRTDAVRARFDEVRVRILTTIVAATPEGYGASDARFLLGRIMWDRGDVDGAFEWWRDAAPDGRGSYREAADGISRALAAPSGGRVAEISSVLGAEYRRWLTSSAERLEQFGYSFDTF